MLCTFASLEELRVFSGELPRHEGAVVFHASSAEKGEASSFFGLMLAHSNVSTAEDERSIEDLRESFPTVDTSVVDAVWKGQKSWGACFDVLNSLRCSTKSKSLLLEDCSFLLDSISWPKLSESQAVKNSSWTIGGVQSLSAALGKLGFSDSMDSWEILNQPASPPTVADENTAAATTSSSTAGANSSAEGAKRGTVRSYKEALQKSPTRDLAATTSPAENARKKVAPWKPSIVVQAVKYEHKDKLYQHNVPAGATVSAYEQEEDDDVYDAGSYFQSSEYAKGMVSVNRMRAATMLKPAALEKKMARIASRAALRPPVPGAAADSGEDSD